MDTSKLELKIVSDSNGKSIELDNLSILAAKSLNIFLDSLINLVDAVPLENRASLTFQVKKGSACVAVEGFSSGIEYLEKNFEEVVNCKSTNKELVNNWKAIQDVILANGLNYEVNIVTPQKGKVTLIEKIKTSPFKVKIKRHKADTNIHFLKGKLIAIGGSRPNFHLYNDQQEETIVQCDEVIAKKISSLLYTEIYVSTWCKKTPGTKPIHTYADAYIHESDFLEFRNFVTKNIPEKDSEEFIKIHDKIREIVEKQDFGKLKKFMKLFNHSSVEPSTLKTILVNTKAFRNHPNIIGIRNSIKEILEKKIGHPLI